MDRGAPTDQDRSLLFAPLAVRGVEFRNRIVMPPMVVNRGIVTPAGIAWYGARARGGVAMVIIEATNVDGFVHRYTVERLRDLVDAIHAGGALAAIQLFPGTRGQRVTPAELDRERIAALVGSCADAAAQCARAGFDGVEIHGAHGFLLNQFFSPVQNARTDRYGGGLSGRMMLAVQMAGAARAALPDGALLLYRHTPVGDGYTIEESLELGRALVDAGVDILDLSPSSIDLPGDRSAPFRTLGAPVIAVNELDRVDRALEALREGRADLVAVGRGLIADPMWAEHVRAGEEPLRCVRCDRCHAHLSVGRPVRCVQWRDEAEVSMEGARE